MDARRVRSGLVILPLLLYGALPQAHADIVEYRIDGVITAASDPNGVSPIPIAVGDFFSIYFAYDTAAQSYTYNVESTLYYNAIREVRLRFGDQVYPWANPTTFGEIGVRDNYHPSPFHDYTDGVFFQASTGSIIDQALVASWSMTASEPSSPSTVFNSMALPGVLPSLDRFDSATAFFNFINGPANQAGSYSGTLLAMSPVPLPAPLLLLASGLLGVLSSRRLPNRSRS